MKHTIIHQVVIPIFEEVENKNEEEPLYSPLSKYSHFLQEANLIALAS